MHFQEGLPEKNHTHTSEHKMTQQISVLHINISRRAFLEEQFLIYMFSCSAFRFVWTSSVRPSLRPSVLPSVRLSDSLQLVCCPFRLRPFTGRTFISDCEHLIFLRIRGICSDCEHLFLDWRHLILIRIWKHSVSICHTISTMLTKNRLTHYIINTTKNIKMEPLCKYVITSYKIALCVSHILKGAATDSEAILCWW